MVVFRRGHAPVIRSREASSPAWWNRTMSYYRLRSKEIGKRCGVTWSGKSSSRRELFKVQCSKVQRILIVLGAVDLPNFEPRTLNFGPVGGLAVLIFRTGEVFSAVVSDIETQAWHLCEIFAVHVDFHSVPIRDVIHLMNVVVRRD